MSNFNSIQAKWYHGESIAANTTININSDLPNKGLVRLTWWVGFDVPDAAGAVTVDMSCVDRDGQNSNTMAAPTNTTFGSSGFSNAAIWAGQHVASGTWQLTITRIAGTPTYSYQVYAELIGDAELP